MSVTKQILNPNVGVFVSEIVEAVGNGWTVDPQNPAGFYGFHYEIHMVRPEAEVPKPTTTEILTKARAAKAAKKAAEATEAPEATPAAPEPDEAPEQAPEAPPEDPDVQSEPTVEAEGK